MKYFSLAEILYDIPIAFLIGSAVSFVYVLLLVTFMRLSLILRLKEYVKKRLNHVKFTYESVSYKDFYKKRIGFILSEIVGFLFFSAFGVILPVTFYILSDGIPRIYILFSIILGFVISLKVFERPVLKIAYFISRVIFGLIFNLVYSAIYIPMKLYLKLIAIKKRNDKKRIKSDVSKSFK